VVKQTQIDLATLAQQLLAADQNNNAQELTALVKTSAQVVAQTAVWHTPIQIIFLQKINLMIKIANNLTHSSHYL